MFHGTNRVRILISAMLAAASSAALSGQSGKDVVNVTLQSALKHESDGARPLYELTFVYDRPGQREVEIQGLGVLRSKGEVVRLWTIDPKIEFRDASSGLVLTTYALTATTIAMAAGGGVELPADHEFSSVYRSAAIPVSATGRLLEVIQKYFRLGFRSDETGGIVRYSTTYRALPLDSLQNRAEIAVAVSQPHDEHGVKSFHVRYIVRDRPRLSDTWRFGPDRSTGAVAAAEEFIGKLVTELAADGSRP
jgi:hypothetical protein